MLSKAQAQQRDTKSEWVKESKRAKVRCDADIVTVVGGKA